jgi:hypothetical protein
MGRGGWLRRVGAGGVPFASKKLPLSCIPSHFVASDLVEIGFRICIFVEKKGPIGFASSFWFGFEGRSKSAS